MAFAAIRDSMMNDFRKQATLRSRHHANATGRIERASGCYGRGGKRTIAADAAASASNDMITGSEPPAGSCGYAATARLALFFFLRFSQSCTDCLHGKIGDLRAARQR